MQWCKKRALIYVDLGDNQQALISMMSDLDKHPDTKPAAKLCFTLGTGLFVAGALETDSQMRDFINGFN